ncbi:MAG: VWA domain-containing protein [Ardenticatenaceae bacterium]|nr:VWA domain-containing protein [Ardenticatenaceae bacterium]
MERIAKVTFVLGGVFLVALLGLIGYVQLYDEVDAGSLHRQAVPRLLFGAGQSEVTFTRLAQPAVNCPAARRSTHIVLLLDKSGSMDDNGAMSTALEAASLFVTAVELDAAHVSIIFFDEFASLIQSSTQDRVVLQTTLNTTVEPSGSTDIARALQEAERILQTSQAPATAVPIIILLTDGGSDPQAALRVGQQLKDGGVRLVTISLLTTDRNPDLLRTLASSPADYYETPSPAELQAIYTGLAEELNTAVAFNVTITETVKPDLNVLSTSLQPNGTLTENQIVWQIPNLSNNETSFTYQVATTRWGLRTINEEPTIMSYTDCITGVATSRLVSGPSLLVLPPIWILGVLALLPFIPMLAMAWFNRPKATPAPEPRIVAPIEPDPPPDPYPAWLKQLDDSRKTLAAVEIAAAESELTPTMIIGVGPVGRVVLSQIGQTLRARYGGRLPDGVRLLQIDVQPKDVAGLGLNCPEYLESEEWVLLEPDLEEVSRTIQRNPQDWPHLAWYEAAAMEEYGRTRGRMALFYDLMNGADRSILWRSLTRTTTKLDHPKLRLIGSTFDDTGGGMLVDVAWLIQMLTGSNVDVELWLSGPLNEAWSPRLHNPRQLIQVNEQKVRTLATLRELERFQRNVSAPFYYVSSSNVQSQFRQTATAAVVQTLFLFTPPDERSTADDHLTAMSDGLLAVLHKSAQQVLSQHLSRTGARASALTNQNGLGMVCSLGAYSVRMPLGLLEEALTWRMVQELLFEERIGLLPLRRLLADGTYEKIAAEDVTDNAARRRESAEVFVQRYRRRWHTADFFNAVARKVGEQLNGESEGNEPSLGRAGGLIKAVRWLGAVRNQLNIEGESQAVQVMNTLLQQLVDWQIFLEEAVAPLVQERWQTARSKLEQLVSQSGRQWVLPSGLEWPIYRERIRDWLDAPTQITFSEPLVRAAQRFGWHLAWREMGSEWQAQLWLPPGDFIWAGPDSIGDFNAFTVNQNETAFASQLCALVAPLVRHRASTQYALDGAEKLDKRFWLEQAVPLLPINRTEAGNLMDLIGGISEVVILVAPKSNRAVQLQEQLRSTPGAPMVELCQTEDETAVTLLRVRDRVPLKTYEQGYGSEAWQYQYVTPGLYTWRGEQLAADKESDVRLSSLFVSWLEQDDQLVELFARAFLFSLLDFYSRDELELPGLGNWPGKTPGEGLANLFSRDESDWPAVFFNPERRTRALNELAQAIAEEQESIWREPGKRTYLRQAQEVLIDPLINSADGRERDLAIFVQGIIRQL